MSRPPRDLWTVHLPAALWLALVTAALALPGPGPDLPDWVPRFLHFHALDKVVHWVMFAVAGVLLVRSLRRLPTAFPRLDTILCMSLYGIATEIGQYLFTERTGDVADFAADFVGVTCGVLASGLWRSPW